VATADQQNIRIKDAVGYVVHEATFETNPGSPIQIYPTWDSVEFTLDRTPLDNDELRTDLYDAQTHVHGPQIGSGKFTCYLRPDTTQIAAATTATRPWLGQLMHAALGAEHPADATATAGTTIATASSTTSLILASATNVSKGQHVLAEVAGTSTFEPTRVINIATETITLNPALSAAADTGAGSFLQMYNYAPARSFSKSFTIQWAQQGHARLQWTLSGCKMDSLEFDLGMGKIPTASFGYSVSSWSGPSAQSVTATAGTNGMAAPFVMTNCYLLLQAKATTTRASLAFESAAIKLDTGTYGRVGVMRVGGRYFATATIRIRPEDVGSAMVHDATWFESQTELQCILMVSYGTTSAKRWMVFDMPTCVMLSKPRRVDQGGRMLFEFTLRSKMGSVVTSPTAQSDFHNSPFVFAIG
jgi:hypothetical protein